MKKQILTSLAALVLMSGAAFATNPVSCEKSQQQNTYHCSDGQQSWNVSNVSSAEAAAIAIQNQSQGQGQDQNQDQSQSSENNNKNVNGGNSVNIEGDPAHTTSANLGVGVNLDIPIGRGIQGASCRDTVRLAREMGQETLALQIFLECPHVRKLNLKVNPGDKG